MRLRGSSAPSRHLDWPRFAWERAPSCGFEPQTTRLTVGGSTGLSYDGLRAIQGGSSNSFCAAPGWRRRSDPPRPLRAKLLNNRATAFDPRLTRLRYNGFVGPPMIGEKRLFGIIALILGLIAGVLILLNVQSKAGVDLLTLIARIGVLYGSYLIYRGKTSILFGSGQTRLGALINLVIGGFTLLIPGGVGGTPSILSNLGGVPGFPSPVRHRLQA